MGGEMGSQQSLLDFIHSLNLSMKILNRKINTQQTIPNLSSTIRKYKPFPLLTKQTTGAAPRLDVVSSILQPVFASPISTQPSSAIFLGRCVHRLSGER